MRTDRLAALRDLRPQRVCLIKPSSLGDMVHAFPVLASLRELWPDAHLAWVVNRGLRGLLDGHPDLDEVIPFDRSALKASPGGVASIARFLLELRRGRFDLAIDLQGLLRSGVMTLATGAPTRVGLAGSREGSRHCYTHRIASCRSLEDHAVDRLFARWPRASGRDIQCAPGSGSRPALTIFNGPARSLERPPPADGMAINVGARWLTKRLAARTVRERLRAGPSWSEGRAWCSSARPRIGRWWTRSKPTSGRFHLSTFAVRRPCQSSARPSPRRWTSSRPTTPVRSTSPPGTGLKVLGDLHLHQPSQRPVRMGQTLDR